MDQYYSLNFGFLYSCFLFLISQARSPLPNIILRGSTLLLLLNCLFIHASIVNVFFFRSWVCNNSCGNGGAETSNTAKKPALGSGIRHDQHFVRLWAWPPSKNKWHQISKWSQELFWFLTHVSKLSAHSKMSLLNNFVLPCRYVWNIRPCHWTESTGKLVKKRIPQPVQKVWEEMCGLWCQMPKQYCQNYLWKGNSKNTQIKCKNTQIIKIMGTFISW